MDDNKSKLKQIRTYLKKINLEQVFFKSPHPNPLPEGEGKFSFSLRDLDTPLWGRRTG